ncbi:hypothetical protein [Glycomyces buryatensis]|uniref:Uncharacterized protein n=1 Tax=Glycomyces buryatensis TaxID=2570927 RepID=A0A4S8PUU4_9ACTN|nr:hypothetical protein [Glycomyces buryatensis]THV33675.1 hypothetical protein FAB82_26440 [Glycomyces buryatensis]
MAISRFLAPPIPRASGSLHAAIRRLEVEDSRLYVGAVNLAWRNWHRQAYGARGRAPYADGYYCCEYCDPMPGRETIELALHRLPRSSARELRRLVAPLDEHFLGRTYPDPHARQGPWWIGRC